MGAQLLEGQANERVGVRCEARPVHISLGEVVESNALDWLHLVDECLLGVLRPVVRRRDDDPGGEVLLAELDEERGDRRLIDVVVLVVELALNGAELASDPLIANEVDATVSEVLSPIPVAESNDLLKALNEGRLGLHEPADQILEALALVVFVNGCGTQPVQYVVKARHSSPLTASDLARLKPMRRVRQTSAFQQL